MKRFWALGTVLLMCLCVFPLTHAEENQALPREIVEALRGERNIIAWRQHTWKDFSASVEGLGGYGDGSIQGEDGDKTLCSFALADLNADGVNEFIAAVSIGDRFAGVKYLLWDGQQVLG